MRQIMLSPSQAARADRPAMPAVTPESTPQNFKSLCPFPTNSLQKYRQMHIQITLEIKNKKL